MGKLCTVPETVLMNPLLMMSNVREYWQDAHSRLIGFSDAIVKAECYEPRIFHAPSTDFELIGLEPNGFLEYVLPLPTGSWILGWLHATSGLPLEADFPPAGSTFSMQLTDVARGFKFFQKPVADAYFLNDQVQPSNSTFGNKPYVQNPSPKLLSSPYPVAPPGEFKFEFWNQLGGDTNNTLVQMSLLVAVPMPGVKP